LEIHRGYLKGGKVRYVSDDLKANEAMRKKFEATTVEKKAKDEEDNFEF